MSHPQAKLIKCLTIILIMALSTATYTKIETMYRNREAALGIWYSGRFDVNNYPTKESFDAENFFVQNISLKQ